MGWRLLARAVIDAYHRVLAQPVDFWPVFEDEVRKAVTKELPEPTEDERRAAWAQHRREHPADAPSDQTRPVGRERGGLGRGVTYLGPLMPPEAPAPPVAASAQRGASASR